MPPRSKPVETVPCLDYERNTLTEKDTLICKNNRKARMYRLCGCYMFCTCTKSDRADINKWRARFIDGTKFYKLDDFIRNNKAVKYREKLN